MGVTKCMSPETGPCILDPNYIRCRIGEGPDQQQPCSLPAKLQGEREEKRATGTKADQL